VRLGIGRVRIIHGKGSGKQRRRVQAILDRHPLVERWESAPTEAGGWGATLARLKLG
jgi:DNA mismatch repair protein MutS2